jgi:hypothetical protein
VRNNHGQRVWRIKHRFFQFNDCRFTGIQCLDLLLAGIIKLQGHACSVTGFTIDGNITVYLSGPITQNTQAEVFTPYGLIFSLVKSDTVIFYQ